MPYDPSLLTGEGKGGGEIEMTSLPSIPPEAPACPPKVGLPDRQGYASGGGKGCVNLFLAFVLDKNLPQAQKRGAFQKCFPYVYDETVSGWKRISCLSYFFPMDQSRTRFYYTPPGGLKFQRPSEWPDRPLR